MLADLDDLVALGALPDGLITPDATARRGTRLLEFASAQVLAYLRTTEADFVVGATWTAEQITVAAAVVAEAAALRLSVTAAPSTDQMTGGLFSALLNKRHYRTLDRLLSTAGRGTQSIAVDRDDETSYLDWSYAGIMPDNTTPNQDYFGTL